MQLINLFILYFWLFFRHIFCTHMQNLWDLIFILYSMFLIIMLKMLSWLLYWNY